MTNPLVFPALIPSKMNQETVSSQNSKMTRGEAKRLGSRSTVSIRLNIHVASLLTVGQEFYFHLRSRDRIVRLMMRRINENPIEDLERFGKSRCWRCQFAEGAVLEPSAAVIDVFLSERDYGGEDTDNRGTIRKFWEKEMRNNDYEREKRGTY
ncbi:hypothetical protein SISNIDRAFT_527768 [Sistotremastrum niveocremeum HHB9708]|uniref:Uncharacterized protein n=1 Tax=Sistotremastrum niveocremeum HHB9708 TaxID=1314777 RepID=A0A164PU69_9AGAM|nr:hypothetical protein SISNIDRAFT_527768 [Sistotremastrum niveocremeum HHB9708]